MTRLAFLDLETTGLDPRRHDIWEIGVIVRDPDVGEDIEYLWQIRPDLQRADPKALEISRFHERFQVRDHLTAASIDAEDGKPWLGYYSTSEAFIEVQDALHGAHIVGAVPSFDDAFLKAAFHPLSLRIGWHYHLIDVEALAVGYLHGLPQERPPFPHERLPWNSEALSRAVGVDPAQFDRHTALGDARWARAIYDSVTGNTR